MTIAGAGEEPHPRPRLLPLQASKLRVQGAQTFPHSQGNRWQADWVKTNPAGPYNFVGAAGPMEVKSVCPEQCRPPEHQDWTLC